MNTACLLLLFFLLPHAAAEPFVPGQALDQNLVANVAASTFAFVSPRTLTPEPIPRLARWGLRGLTALDARLSTGEEDDTISLLQDHQPLLSRPHPAADDAMGWGLLFGQFVRTAWDSSDSVRRAGTQGIIRVCLNEMLTHLDPYSRYAPPGDAERDRLRRAGRAGIGVTVAHDGGGFIIAGVTADGPAAQAGITSGERILAIDGQTAQGADLASLNALLAGPVGTRVVLTLRGASKTGRDEKGPRGKDKSATAASRVRDIPLVRALVPPETVSSSRLGPLLVLRISSFSSDTGLRFAHEITQGLAGAHPPKGLVVDLRGNRGGLLRQAVAAAGALIADGPVATTAGRDPAAAHEFRADGTDLAHALPVVVLVDGHTASAAEILAAALADRGRAVVVGSSTLGKGLVQTIAPLPDGGELLITWSRVLAPLGWPIQGLGVLPQVCTSMGEESVARQQDELAGGHSVMTRAIEQQRQARPPVSPPLALEIRNACPAAEGSGLDLAAARWLVDHPQAYVGALITPTLGATAAATQTATSATP